MRSTTMGVLLAVIALAFAGAAYYYWTSRGGEGPVTGVVVDKIQRQAGTESGGRTLDQGLRVLTGESFRQDVYHFLIVRTAENTLVEMSVAQNLYNQVEIGDTVQRTSPDVPPVLVRQATP